MSLIVSLLPAGAGCLDGGLLPMLIFVVFDDEGDPFGAGRCLRASRRPSIPSPNGFACASPLSADATRCKDVPAIARRGALQRGTKRFSCNRHGVIWPMA